MKLSIFRSLAASLVVAMMILAGAIGPGEARADANSSQTISGDSGSIDKELTRAERKALRKQEKQAERARRKAEKQAEKERRQAEKAAAKADKQLAKADADGGDKAGKKRDKKPALICKREKLPGSHMRKKVCRTQEEIDAQREADQRLIRDINPAGGSTPG